MICLSFTPPKTQMPQQNQATPSIRIAFAANSLPLYFIGRSRAFINCYYQGGIRQNYIQQAFPYLMRSSFPLVHSSQNADQYLLELQSKLALKEAQKNSSELSSRQMEYDSLFAQCAQSSEFNQLFNNSFNQNHNFSEIDERYYEEDSLFNDKDAEYFQAARNNQEERKSFLPSQDHSKNHRYSSKDSNKILEILRLKDGKAKEVTEKSTNGSLRESTSQTKNSSKSLVIKPKVPRKGDSISISPYSAIKIASKQQDGGALSKRVRTEANQNVRTLNERFNQMCKTEYDNKNQEEAKHPYFMILEEKDSLQCTFKPTLLKECLEEIKNKPANRASYALKEQKESKNSKISNISHSLKLKNAEKERKSLQIPKQKPVLSKKSSAQASGSTLDVATRNQLWLLQKQQRLNIRRKEEEQEKFKKEDFSFKPNINLYKNPRPSVKVVEKEAIPPFFERLSMAKRKSTGIKFKKEQNTEDLKKIESEMRQKNKQNLVCLVNYEREASFVKGKKQSYEQAVKELHNKIMKMNL